MTIRRTTALVILAGTLGGLPASADTTGLPIPKAEQERRMKAIQEKHDSYDPGERLQKKHVGGEYSYNWHARNTDVHGSIDSLRYAVALLDTYDDANLRRAEEVLHRTIGLQVADPQHTHYGVWPWIMEEPVGKGPYVDRNTADFGGKELLHVLLHHKDRLPPAVMDEVAASLRRAVEAIHRRNVRPGYTNIAIMGGLVTLLAGETLGDAAIAERGVERVRRMHTHTKEVGTFTEYNSPTYTMVALEDLAMFRHHVRHPEAKAMVEDLFRTAWEIVAHHIHPPTRQWVGPNSRNYSVFTDRGKLEFIERWTGPAVDFGLNQSPADPALAHMDARCPADLEALMASIEGPRTHVQTLGSADNAPLIETSHQTPRFALSSINYQDTWNQRRNVIGFWGSGGNPSYCRVRLMFDGYDLSTGFLQTRQNDGRVLGIVSFSTDGGGKHISLDKLKDGTFEASQLSLRFEFGGPAGAGALTAPASLAAPVQMTLDGLPVAIHVPLAAFDGCAIGWTAGQTEVSRVGQAAYLDITIHSGESRLFKLHEIGQAAVVFALQLGGGAIVPASATATDGLLTATWSGMTVTAPLKPATTKMLRSQIGN